VKKYTKGADGLILHYRYGIPYYPTVSKIYKIYTHEKLQGEHAFFAGDEHKIELLKKIINLTIETFHDDKFV